MHLSLPGNVGGNTGCVQWISATCWLFSAEGLHLSFHHFGVQEAKKMGNFVHMYRRNIRNLW